MYDSSPYNLKLINAVLNCDDPEAAIAKMIEKDKARIKAEQAIPKRRKTNRACNVIPFPTRK